MFAVVFWGAVMAYVLLPLAAFMERRGLGRTAASFVSVALVVGAVVALFVFEGPQIGHQVAVVARTLPGWLSHIGGQLQGFQDKLLSRDLPPSVRLGALKALHRREGDLMGFVDQFASRLMGILPSLLNIPLAPVIAYYLLTSRDRLLDSFLGLFTYRFRPEVVRLLSDVEEVVSGFLRGQIIIGAVVGTLAWLVMVAFGVGYGVLVGAVAALVEIVPIFGPLVGALFAVAITAAVKPQAVVWIAASFFAIQQFEGGLIAPQLTGMVTGLHPLAVIIGLVVGGEVAGLFGMLLSVPALGVAVVLSRWAFRQLVEPASGPP